MAKKPKRPAKERPFRPFMCRWTKDFRLAPHGRFVELCQRQFVVGEDYAITLHEERSTAEHNAMFAAIGSCWKTLPDAWLQRMRSREHFRAWLLVQVGHAYHSQEVWDTPKDAERHARAMRRQDDYAVIKVSGNVVDVWIAKSVARSAVPRKQDFKVIAEAVHAKLAEITGLTRDEVKHEGKRNAAPPARMDRFAGGEQ